MTGVSDEQEVHPAHRPGGSTRMVLGDDDLERTILDCLEDHEMPPTTDMLDPSSQREFLRPNNRARSFPEHAWKVRP